MKTIFLVILLFYTLFSNAQNEKQGVAGREKFVTIEMSKLPIAEFPRKAISVSNIRVIQAVIDSFRMGYTVKGMNHSGATLKFDKPLTVILQEQATRMYKHEYKKDGVEILWVVKNLRFGEKAAIMRYTYTRFNADAYISEDGIFFKEVCTIDTVLFTETVAGHGVDIENAFRVLLKRTLLTGKDVQEKNSEGLTIKQINNQAQKQKEVTILRDSDFKEGAYMNFEEFLQNKPSIINFETAVVDKRKIRFVNSDSNASEKTLHVWGLCKQGEIYKYYDESLIPIEKQGSSFIISNYVESKSRRNRNQFFLSLMGGIASGIVLGTAVIVDANDPKRIQLLVKSISHITNPNKQPVATCIDMKTGEFSF